MAHWVMYPMLSLQQLGLLPYHVFDPCPGNLHMPMWPKKKKERILSGQEEPYTQREEVLLCSLES